MVEKKKIEKITFKCEKCGKETSKYPRAIKKTGYFCKNCLTYTEKRTKKIFQTKLEKYGSQGYCNIEKIKRTKLEKYGNENYCNVKKIKETKLEKYGDSNYNNRKKSKKTCLEKYGVENIQQSDSIKQKRKQTCIDKYGGVFLQSDEIKKKSKKTCLEKYGSEWALQNSDIRKKTKQTNLLRYGSEIATQNKEIAKRISLTKQQKSPEELKEIAIKMSTTRSKIPIINGIKPDSYWEESFIKLHPGCERGPCIKYIYNNKEHYWNIDFKWEEKYYEVKSPFLFNKNYKKWKPELTWAKWKIGKKLKVYWYLWNPGELGLFDQEEDLARNLNYYKNLNDFLIRGKIVV
jgi:hypothetical protein